MRLARRIDVTDHRGVTGPILTRREFICGTAAACVVGASAACSDAPTAGGERMSIDITDAEVVIPLAAAPALARDGGHFVVRPASVIVLNLGASGFRAFSNVCTHAGCGVDRFERSRMICPCHGSEYDTNGINVAGPAPAPLPVLRVEYNAVRDTVRVERR